MLTVRIIRENGKHAKRAEIVSLYASDTDFVPYLRDRTIDGDGTIHLKVPEGPVIQLTKSLAIEWVKRGVRVNSISPGYIGTDLTLSSPTLQPLIAQWNAMAPTGRLGRPEELESICVYLAGDTSTFTTGADFILDGAFTCF